MFTSAATSIADSELPIQTVPFLRQNFVNYFSKRKSAKKAAVRLLSLIDRFKREKGGCTIGMEKKKCNDHHPLDVVVKLGKG